MYVPLILFVSEYNINKMSTQYLLENRIPQDMIDYITDHNRGLGITLNDDYSNKFVTLHRLFLRRYGIADGPYGANIHFWSFLHNELGPDGRNGRSNLQVLDETIEIYRSLLNRRGNNDRPDYSIAGGKRRKTRKTKKSKSRKTKRRRV